MQDPVDLFASQPATVPATSPTVDLFAADPVVQQDTTAPKFEPADANIVDPFAAVPLNSFVGSDIFGSFTSNSDSASKEATQNPINDGNLNNMSTKSSQDSKPPQKKDTFQVKSGIWADSLSRGIIDLNISARKYLLSKSLLFVCKCVYLSFLRPLHCHLKHCSQEGFTGRCWHCRIE